jgi:hypothetical protein
VRLLVRDPPKGPNGNRWPGAGSKARIN